MSQAPPAGWSYPESPFHRGERAVQERVGVHEVMESRARKVIRNHMPDQHREFFAQLPFIIIGALDAQAQPWASVLVGQPGFIASPDAFHLNIRARPLAADPLTDTLSSNAPIGLLGIEPATRRRNRMNGLIEASSADSFSVRVNRSFGNCPKYIQARTPDFVDSVASDSPEKTEHRGDRLDDAMRHLVGQADTLYIASAFTDDDDALACPHGVDVSHRGGKSGFVRIDDDKTLTIPDFVGNMLFNTIGNLLLNPRAGVLFIDFSNGDLLYLAVDTEIIWDGPEVSAFKGAERLLRFHIRHALRVEASLPLRWSDAELSPQLEQTGTWGEAARATDAN